MPTCFWSRNHRCCLCLPSASPPARCFLVLSGPCPCHLLWDSMLTSNICPPPQESENRLHLFLAGVGSIGILLVFSYLGPSYYNSILSFSETPPCTHVFLRSALHSVNFSLPSLFSPGLTFPSIHPSGAASAAPASHLHDVKMFFHD